MRIGGKSFLPEEMEWPVNPNGEKLTLILNIPTNYQNDILSFNYPKDKVISVFTTYNIEDYFLDMIVYHGNREELDNIRNGFTRVILHDKGVPRNDSIGYLYLSNEIDINGIGMFFHNVVNKYVGIRCSRCSGALYI